MVENEQAKQVKYIPLLHAALRDVSITDGFEEIVSIRPENKYYILSLKKEKTDADFGFAW